MVRNDETDARSKSAAHFRSLFGCFEGPEGTRIPSAEGFAPNPPVAGPANNGCSHIVHGVGTVMESLAENVAGVLKWSRSDSFGCQSGGLLLGCNQRVSQQHGDGHGADSTGNRRDGRRGL